MSTHREDERTPSSIGSSAATTARSLPFDHVVITFPDSAAAAAASSGPLTQLRQLYSTTTQFTATCDPWGCRVGSGGGTLAALVDHDGDCFTGDDGDYCYYKKKNDTGVVLILHAGGAASRSPTQMCLGKAWTSLPATESAESDDRLHTPLQLWLELLANSMFRNGLPKGTFVVVASDTLLDLPPPPTKDASLDWHAILSTANSVVAVAVPAPITTAQNHGVFVLPEQPSATSSSTTTAGGTSIAPCQRVLQKPSLDVLLKDDCSFWPDDSSNNNSHNSEQQQQQQRHAWIDTGVAIFSPAAAATFRQLANGLAGQRCTAQGIQGLWSRHYRRYATPTRPGVSLPEFASTVAMSVDLYTHVMRALRLAADNDEDATTTSSTREQYLQQQSRREQYLQQHEGELDTVLLCTLWNALSHLALHVWTLPQGRFWHLGTTRELQQFLVYGCGSLAGDDGTATTTIDDDDAALVDKTTQEVDSKQQQQSLTLKHATTQEHNGCRAFGRRLGLTRRRRACTWLGCQYDGSRSVHPTAVVMNSLLHVLEPSSTKPTNVLTDLSWIGAETVIEHCNIQVHKRLRIGHGCLVSGLRSSSSSVVESSIDIPDGLMVHMLPLRSVDDRKDHSYAVIVLGMDDSIKQRDTLYGISFEVFQTRTHLSDNDIWNDTEECQKSLWTAKLHPVIDLEGHGDCFSSVFSWLTNLLSGSVSPSVEDDVSFQKWKTGCLRLSLAEIRDQADAPTEFAFRDSLSVTMEQKKSLFFQSMKNAAKDGSSSVLPLRNLHWVVDEFAANAAVASARSRPSTLKDVQAALHSVDDVVFESLQPKDPRYDVAARGFWILSGFLDELAVSVPESSTSSEPENLVLKLRTSIVELSSSREWAKSLQDMFRTRDELLALCPFRESLRFLSQIMENLAARMTSQHVCAARGISQYLGMCQTVPDVWVLASAPARIDLSGGWSDTPPICFDGSVVTGMAVLVDRRRPLACRARIVTGSTGMLLRAESRSLKDGELISCVECELSTMSDFIQGHNDPSADCALLKCVLVHLGLVQHFEDDGSDFQSMLNKFCQSGSANVRLEVIATSLLPQGSGLGTSSILAGVILAAVGKCIGVGCSSPQQYETDLIDSVLCVEQNLTTGGGFQDQVNGLIGGIKTVAVNANDSPMRLSVEQLQVSSDFRHSLNNHLVLVYTGQTRLAKNLLQNVLRRWSKRTPEIVDTVSHLIQGAKDCQQAVQDGDMDGVGLCLSRYWQLKMTMARGVPAASSSASMEGPDVEPPAVRLAIETLQKSGLLRGASLCGAGGGGFLILLTSDLVSSSSDLIDALQEACPKNSPDSLSELTSAFSWHDCRLSNEGLLVRQLDASIVDDTVFDISWLVVN